MTRSSKEWIMEHRDANRGVYWPIRDGSHEWTEWKTAMTLETVLERLAEMSIRGTKYYDYRARNLRTGEIIPGEIMCR